MKAKNLILFLAKRNKKRCKKIFALLCSLAKRGLNNLLFNSHGFYSFISPFFQSVTGLTPLCSDVCFVVCLLIRFVVFRSFRLIHWINYKFYIFFLTRNKKQKQIWIDWMCCVWCGCIEVTYIKMTDFWQFSSRLNGCKWNLRHWICLRDM